VADSSLTAEPAFYDRVRSRAENAFLYLGGLTELAQQTLTQLWRGPMERALLMAQLDQVGTRSISIVVITSMFIGMVLALQTAYSLADFGGKLFVGKVVSLSLIRELAPVLMSLMVGGRVGAGMTAEIGTMKVLVVPRVVATTFMFPLLTVISCALGIIGGLFIAVANLHLSANFYMRSVIESISYNDLASGVGKTIFFGFSTGLIACFNGRRSCGGR
jgi:phospholipid/cholesterol/gamma-HCH transport system permease protein